MGKRKYVADELAELLTPGGGAEHDPDALDRLGQGAVLEASDDELQAQAQQPAARRRLRGAIDLGALGARYQGRKTTRAAMFDQDVHPSDDDDDGSQSMLSDDLHPQDSDHAQHTSGNEEEEEQGASHDEDDSPARSPALTSNGLTNGQHTTDLQAAFASIEADDAAAVTQLSDRAAKERQKGQAVAAQQTLWSRALELRMVLQKGLTAANALPLPDDIAVLRAAPGPAATLRSLTDAMHGTLRDMLTLHDTLVQQHAAIGTAAESAGAPSALAPLEDGAASLDAAWTALVQRDAMVAPFRDASVDRWHRKVLLGSSGSMRGGLQALNQSVSQQVATLMQAPDRLVQRMRLPASAVKRVSLHGEGVQGAMDDNDDPPDPETFDDAELYGALLREFLDSSHVDGATMSALQSRTKKRKQVDRKASKGRKLRYHVHEKLVNFTAPVPLPDTGFAAQLAATLFGARGNGP